MKKQGRSNYRPATISGEEIDPNTLRKFGMRVPRPHHEPDDGYISMVRMLARTAAYKKARRA